MSATETYRAVIYPQYLDHMGHMNVQHYVGHFDQASWSLLAMIGITRSYIKQERKGIVALEQNIRYHREVLEGTLIAVRSHIAKVGNSSMEIRHTMYDPETDDLFAEMVLKSVHFDLEARRPAPIPEEIKGQIKSHMA